MGRLEDARAGNSALKFILDGRMREGPLDFDESPPNHSLLALHFEPDNRISPGSALLNCDLPAVQLGIRSRRPIHWSFSRLEATKSRGFFSREADRVLLLDHCCVVQLPLQTFDSVVLLSGCGWILVWR